MTDTEGESAEWSFPAVPGSVRGARHAVRDALHHWGLDDAVGDVAVLLVSELVTNSLRHASGPIGVRLVRPRPGAPESGVREPDAPESGAPESGTGPGPSPGEAPDADAGRRRLLVEVSDPVPDPPTERSAGPGDETGRGLRLVACSARRWGTRHGKSGKTVWFELPLPG